MPRFNFSRLTRIPLLVVKALPAHVHVEHAPTREDLESLTRGPQEGSFRGRIVLDYTLTLRDGKLELDEVVGSSTNPPEKLE